MSFINYWFNHRSFWSAGKEVDHTIRNALGMDYACLMEERCKKPLDFLNNIMVLDQLVPRLYRGNSILIERCQKQALALVDTAIALGYDVDLTPQQQCFFLSPMRKSDEHAVVHHAVSRIVSYTDWVQSPCLLKVYKICIRRTVKLAEPCRVSKVCFTRTSYELLNPKIAGGVWCEPCDGQCDPADFIPAELPQGKLVVCVSGTIGSMVCLRTLLAKATDDKRELNVLHINYGDSGDCMRVQRFVEEYCSACGITCYVRQVTETHRERGLLAGFYESILDTIRLAAYRFFGSDALIVLGCTHDDQVNNTINDVRDKRMPQKLLRFETRSDVTVWRPLIGVKVDKLVQYARRNAIPTPLVTTPTTVLEDDMIPGFLWLSSMAEQQAKVIDSCVYEPMRSGTVWGDRKVIVPCNRRVSVAIYSSLFMQTLIADIARHLGVKVPPAASMLKHTKCFIGMVDDHRGGTIGVGGLEVKVSTKHIQFSIRSVRV